LARILVTDAHLASALAVIRSLGRQGHHVIAGSSQRTSPGFFSRWAGERVRYPDPALDPATAAAALLKVVGERAVELVIPVTDETILALSLQRDRIEELCPVALPGADALAVARDKWSTLALARRLCVPTPPSALIATAAEAEQVTSDFRWPIVIKPLASRVVNRRGSIERLGVAYASSAAELAYHMRKLEGLCPAILQEYTAGTGVGVEVLAWKGEVLVAFQHRRLREVPITGGASSFRESVALDPVLLDHTSRLLQELEWTGLAMIEFKAGACGPTLMEINGRIWGSLPLAVKSGIDFPALLAERYLSPHPAESEVRQFLYKLGVRSRHLELELVWVASVLRGARRYPFLPQPSRAEAARVALRLLSPADGFDVASGADPVPGLIDAGRVGVRLLRKAAREA